MAKTTAEVGEMVAILTAGVAARIDAVPGLEMVVVLHVTDDAHVSPSSLAEAEQQATRVYHTAGVRAVWTGGTAQTAQPDGGFHVDVVIRSTDREAGNGQSEQNAEAVLGRASGPTRRAYIFYDRIFNHAG